MGSKIDDLPALTGSQLVAALREIGHGLPQAAADRIVELERAVFTYDELGRLRQWHDAVSDVTPEYLEPGDAQLAAKIKAALLGDIGRTLTEHSEFARKAAPLHERIAQLEHALLTAARHLEAVYGSLPADKPPGPPTSIIETMRSVALSK